MYSQIETTRTVAGILWIPSIWPVIKREVPEWFLEFKVCTFSDDLYMYSTNGNFQNGKFSDNSVSLI